MYSLSHQNLVYIYIIYTDLYWFIQIIYIYVYIYISDIYQIYICIRGGPHMRSLISIDFPAPKMEPESAHVVSAVSVHWLQCGDCDAARPRQHTTPGQKFFLLTSRSNPLPLDSWQVSYESHGGSRISWFAFKEFYFIPTWITIRHAGHAKWG